MEHKPTEPVHCANTAKAFTSVRAFRRHLVNALKNYLLSTLDRGINVSDMLARQL